MKNREIDLLIVVNMFLTGFDATTLNTLWVDKNSEDAGTSSGIFQNQQDIKFRKSFWKYCVSEILKKQLRQYRIIWE